MDAKSKPKEEQTKGKKKKNRVFAEFLEEASEAYEHQKMAGGQLAGYTNHAQSVYYTVPQREYV